jgi:AcrR family transcriptional regulator
VTRATVPRPLGRPKDGVSAETRARLLAVARIAFASDGFDGTTNKAIADRTGITTAAIYHYYASKAELYIAVYDEVQRIVFDAFEQAIAPHTTLLARFSAALDASVRLDCEDPSITSFVMGVGGEARRNPELRALLAPMRVANGDVMHRLVCEAAARGEIAQGVDLRALEDLLNSVLAGLARFSSHTADRKRHAQVVDVLKRFMAGNVLTR